jgi:uncharacterized membrane protein YozB (DUF420 family)
MQPMVTRPAHHDVSPGPGVRLRAADPVNRALGFIALLGLAIMIVICLLVQWLRTDLNWITVPLSMYLEGRYGAWVQASFFALAPGVVALATGTYRALDARARSIIPAGLFILAAVALCVMACHMPDATPWPVTRHGIIHQWAAFATFMGTTLAMLVQSWGLRRDRRWHRRYRQALAVAIAAFVGFWLFALIRAIPRGAGEKAVIALALLWLWRAAWQLLRAG